MMKKILPLLLVFAMCFTLAACGNRENAEMTETDPSASSERENASVESDKEQDKEESSNAQQTDGSETGSPTVLVVYFSATNTTEGVAQVIANTLNADILELEPVNPYTSEDLNYGNSSSRVCREHDDPSLQDIELTVTTPDNWDEYDTVFIGYPIWWHAAAWPVNNFVTENDFTGKTVIPFCTSASSGLEGSDTALRDMAGTGNWLSGRNFFSRDSEDTIAAWVNGLDIPMTTEQTTQSEPAGTQLSFSAGDTEIIATLNDLPLAQEITEALPATLTMTRLYEREYYGTSLNWEPDSSYETQVECTPGTLAYWPRGNSLVLLFAHNDEHPTIDSGIVVIGEIQTELSAFDRLDRTVEMTVSVID